MLRRHRSHQCNNNMENETENEVPEITAANPDGGAADLNADPITSDLSDQMDSLLDAAERETNPQPDTSNENDPSQTDSLHSADPAGTDSPETGSDSGSVDLQNPQDNAGGTSLNETLPPDIDPEIAAIEQPRNLSENNQNNWRKLQETASYYKKQAAEAEILKHRLQELESKPASVPEDYEELRKFRAIFDIKNDPGFKSAYEVPINSASENIYQILRKNGAPDEVIKSIQDAGGPDKISDKWWQENAISKLPLTDAERLKKSLVDVIDLKEKQEKDIALAAEYADQFQAAKRAEHENWFKTEQQTIAQHVDSLTKDYDWARYHQIKGTETEEELAKINKHNEAVASLESKFTSALWPKDAAERANVAAAAAFSHVLADQLRYEQKSRASMAEQIKRLTAENSKLKASGKMPKQSITTPTTIKTNDLNSRIKMNPSDAIDLGLDEAGA